MPFVVGIEKSPTYIALPEYVKLTPSYAQFELFLRLLQLVRSLKVRPTVARV